MRTTRGTCFYLQGVHMCAPPPPIQLADMGSYLLPAKFPFQDRLKCMFNRRNQNSEFKCFYFTTTIEWCSNLEGAEKTHCEGLSVALAQFRFYLIGQRSQTSSETQNVFKRWCLACIVLKKTTCKLPTFQSQEISFTNLDFWLHSRCWWGAALYKSSELSRCLYHHLTY